MAEKFAKKLPFGDLVVRLSKLFFDSMAQAGIGAVCGVIVERACNRLIPVDHESKFVQNAIRVAVQLPLGLVFLGSVLLVLGNVQRVDTPIEASTLLLFFCTYALRFFSLLLRYATDGNQVTLTNAATDDVRRLALRHFFANTCVTG
jgi:hypothetical protein